jgi:hypothetical protein
MGFLSSEKNGMKKRFGDEIKFTSTALLYLNLHNYIFHYHTSETFHRVKSQICYSFLRNKIRSLHEN